MNRLQSSKREKDEQVYACLNDLLKRGRRRSEAISEVQEMFSIVHPQTVYNIEKRVKARKENTNGE